MTYDMFGGTLNLAQSQSTRVQFVVQVFVYVYRCLLLIIKWPFENRHWLLTKSRFSKLTVLLYIDIDIVQNLHITRQWKRLDDRLVARGRDVMTLRCLAFISGLGRLGTSYERKDAEQQWTEPYVTVLGQINWCKSDLLMTTNQWWKETYSDVHSRNVFSFIHRASLHRAS